MSGEPPELADIAAFHGLTVDDYERLNLQFIKEHGEPDTERERREYGVRRAWFFAGARFILGEVTTSA